VIQLDALIHEAVHAIHPVVREGVPVVWIGKAAVDGEQLLCRGEQSVHAYRSVGFVFIVIGDVAVVRGGFGGCRLLDRAAVAASVLRSRLPSLVAFVFLAATRRALSSALA